MFIFKSTKNCVWNKRYRSNNNKAKVKQIDHVESLISFQAQSTHDS